MKSISLFLILLFSVNDSITESEARWGQTGHRAVGYIAESLLTDQAKSEVERVLGGNSLAEVSTWMDEIRSDPSYRYMNPWHYCTIPDGMTYEEAGTPEEGDAVWAIEKMIEELKSGELTEEQEAINLKVLVHLVGDLHQPMHAGNGTDRGGNDVRVQWFGDDSNLHRVWDSEMIDSRQHYGTELADFSMNDMDTSLFEEWQSASVVDWAHESNDLLVRAYDFEGDRLSYAYMYQNFDIVYDRIAMAGVRLAGVINDIYSE